MEHYSYLEVNISDNGTVRVYGNGGMIFEASGNNIRAITSMYPQKPLASGEAVRDKKNGN